VFNRLIRFCHPSDEELREMAGVPKDLSGKGKGKGGGGKYSKDDKNPNAFHVPKNLELRVRLRLTFGLEDVIQINLGLPIIKESFHEYIWSGFSVGDSQSVPHRSHALKVLLGVSLGCGLYGVCNYRLCCD
jgi:hypothetical protein